MKGREEQYQELVHCGMYILNGRKEEEELEKLENKLTEERGELRN